MSPRFGTDGVRGVANQDLTPELAVALGRALVAVLRPERVVVGRDTRRSGSMLESALAAGVCSAGAEVELLGVVPTPAVARVAHSLPDTAGAMISASHNPFADNGIKVFGCGGSKLSDKVEAQIEAHMHALLGLSGETTEGSRTESPRPTAEAVGQVTIASHRAQDWTDSIEASVTPGSLAALHVVVDAAHGAASEWAAPILTRLGATVTTMGDQPTGININAGVGSTAPAALAAQVVAQGADVGLAFDGDADRLIAVDETGVIVDGDRVIGLLACDYAERGALNGNTVVVTVMTNLGFHLAMRQRGIDVVSTQVGDRYVLAALDEHGYSLGGEQSGHVICRDLGLTGDGVLTAVQLLDVVARSGQPLSKLAGEFMTTIPQVLFNIDLPERRETIVQELQGEITQVESEFGEDGRVLVRLSGTEPLLRVMVEHLDSATAEHAAQRLGDAARRIMAIDGPS